MDAINRRSLLKAGGALGVLGTVAAQSTPVWAWNTSQSVAGGSLETVPPENVWDPEADAIVHRLFTEEGISRIDELNALLRPWHHNSQALPDGLPDDLAAFIETARQPPAWLDRAKLADAVDFNETRGTYLGLLYGLGSGIMSCAIPDEARAVYHSKGGEDMRDRVSKTAKLGYDIGTPDAYDPGGEMIATCVKVRLTHSAVRYLITSSDRWNNSGDLAAPISQRDLMITWHSLATFIFRTLGRWEIPVTSRHAEGYLHLWQVAAHYLGIEHAYIPATWVDAEYQSDLTLDPVLAPTPEGISLADTLLSLLEEYDLGITRPILDAMTRYTMGTNRAGVKIADMLEITPRPFWERSIENGWPWYLAAREAGAGLPLFNHLYWTFDEILRMGVLWGTAGRPGPVYIEMPTENRSEDSYPPSSY